MVDSWSAPFTAHVEAMVAEEPYLADCLPSLDTARRHAPLFGGVLVHRGELPPSVAEALCAVPCTPPWKAGRVENGSVVAVWFDAMMVQDDPFAVRRALVAGGHLTSDVDWFLRCVRETLESEMSSGAVHVWHPSLEGDRWNGGYMYSQVHDAWVNLAVGLAARRVGADLVGG